MDEYEISSASLKGDSWTLVISSEPDDLSVCIDKSQVDDFLRQNTSDVSRQTVMQYLQCEPSFQRALKSAAQASDFRPVQFSSLKLKEA